MTMPPLPPPDLEEHETELWGQNVCDDYWRQAKMRAYGAACAAAAVKAEREECATLCDEKHALRSADGFPREASTARALAAAIRARGEA